MVGMQDIRQKKFYQIKKQNLYPQQKLGRKIKFDFIYLGQTVLKYQVPLEVFLGLNEIYERQKKQLPKANKQLVGKIEDEVSLYY